MSVRTKVDGSGIGLKLECDGYCARRTSKPPSFHGSLLSTQPRETGIGNNTFPPRTPDQVGSLAKFDGVAPLVASPCVCVPNDCVR